MSADRDAVVYYANDDQFHILALVRSYANSWDQVSLLSGKQLLLESRSGSLQLTGLNTICRYIAELGPKKDQLLGTDDVTKAQVCPAVACSLPNVPSFIASRLQVRYCRCTFFLAQ